MHTLKTLMLKISASILLLQKAKNKIHYERINSVYKVLIGLAIFSISLY